MKTYILDGKEPKLCEDIQAWAAWYESADRVVRKSVCNHVRISTVFLGMDHNFGEGQPLLFETMIFGGKHDQYQERYSTWEAAEAGHAEALAMVNG